MRQTLLILLIGLNLSGCKILRLSDELKKNSTTIYGKLFVKLMKDKRYESLLLYGEETNWKFEWFNILDTLQTMEIPAIIISSKVNMKISEKFNNEVVAWICLHSLQNRTDFSDLASALDHMRYTRVIVQVMGRGTHNDLNNFYEFSTKLQMLNVMVCFEDFPQTGMYYLYGLFSPSKLEEHVFNPVQDQVIFPQRIQNMQGYPLRTLVEHTIPQAIEYYDAEGNRRLAGQLGRFVTSLAEKWNTTLTFPYDVPHNVAINYRKFLPLMRNYSLDVPATSSAVFRRDDFREFSYPFELSYACLLLPVEHPWEFRYILLHLMESFFMAIMFGLIAAFSVIFYCQRIVQTPASLSYNWPIYVINTDVIQGVFGFSVNYKSQKRFSLNLLYITLFVCGLTNSSLFNSKIYSYITHPSPSKPIRNYEDLENSPLKVAIAQVEFDYFNYVSNISSNLSRSKFYIMENITDFYKLRDTFDNRYCYFTSAAKMFHYKSFQQVKGVKMFRLSKEMCPNPLMLLHIPLSPNSYFRQAINFAILEVWQSGLLYYWQSISNADVVKTGNKIRVNLTTSNSVSLMRTKDMNVIFLIYFVIMLIAFIVFAVEIIVFQIYNKR